MSNFYTYTGTDIVGYHVDRIVQDDGKEIVLGIPVQLSEEELAALQARHFVFEQSSVEESEAVAVAISNWQKALSKAGDDLRGTAPLLGDSNKSAESGTDHHKEVN